MGFQTGSQIRPELGALDYSGYTNAANIQAQAMANLGQQIGGAIEGFYEDKEKKKEDDLRLNAVKSFLPSIGIDKTNPDFDQLASSLSKNKDLLETYTQIGQITKEQEARKNAIASAYTVTKDGNKFDPKVAVESYIGLSGNDPEGFGQIAQSIASQPEQKVILTPEQVSAYVNQGYALQGKPTPEGYMEVDKSSIKPESGPLVSVDLGGGKDTSKFDEEMAKRTASQVVDWELGGRVNAVANLNAYNDIYSKLASGEYNTRTLADLSPVLSDELRTIFNPTGQAAVDNVRKVVFQSLRDTLGAQFTEKEAIRLTNATYNPSLSEQENMQRMKIAGDVLKETIRAKDDVSKFISQGGQMKDYKGQSPIDAFNKSISSFESKEDKPSGIPEDIDPSIWNELSDEQKKLWNQ